MPVQQSSECLEHDVAHDATLALCHNRFDASDGRNIQAQAKGNFELHSNRVKMLSDPGCLVGTAQCPRRQFLSTVITKGTEEDVVRFPDNVPVWSHSSLACLRSPSWVSLGTRRRAGNAVRGATFLRPHE